MTSGILKLFTYRALLLSATAIILSACGGGGNTAPVVPVVSPTPAVSVATVPSATASAPTASAPTHSATGLFDSALWRIVSVADRLTVGADAAPGKLAAQGYTGDKDQHWRMRQVGANQYEIRLEVDGRCLVSQDDRAVLSHCNGTNAVWTIYKIGLRTESYPALYEVRNASNLCLINATKAMGSCVDNSLWYIEPVGFGERSSPPAYTISSLLIVKPQANLVNPFSQGKMSDDQVTAVQVGFKERTATLIKLMTDGSVVWKPTAVVSPDPLTSLTVAGGNYLPTAENMPADIQRYVPRGLYDTVEVYFTPGSSLSGGWGWGPGSSYASNFTLWATVNGRDTRAMEWYSTVNGEPFEVFIHEAMHGYDRYAFEHGVPLPQDWLHGTGVNLYERNKVSGTSYLHWYRDYWLGTIIAADGTYVGYGPRLFRHPTPRQFATSADMKESAIVQKSSGLCVSTGDGSTNATDPRVVLSSTCNKAASSFVLQSTGMIKHLGSGACIHPLGGTARAGVAATLYGSCAPEDRLLFTRTAKGSLKNVSTGLCLSPSSGFAKPDIGTPLTFWSTCDEDYQRFDLIEK